MKTLIRLLLQKQSDLGLICLSRPFWQAFTVFAENLCISVQQWKSTSVDCCINHSQVQHREINGFYKTKMPVYNAIKKEYEQCGHVALTDHRPTHSDARKIHLTKTAVQRRSQNAEKITHIKGRLLDQAMILFNCVPFQMGTSLKGKNLLPDQRERILPFMRSSL